MREIKFRTWNTRRKTMEMVDDLYWFEENYCHHNGDNEYVIQQYTGLKDKNGVEIYEGDLIKGHNLPIGDNPAEVCWLQNSLSYQVDGKFCGCELSKLDAKSIVVVGNVYEGVDK